MTPPKQSAKTAPAAAPVEAQPLPEKGIGGRIKEARQDEKNNLNIEALSRLSKMIDPVGQGITRTTLVRYESGEVLPGAREIRILCNALNVTADWLVMGRELQAEAQVDGALNLLSRVMKARLTKEDTLGFLDSDGLKTRKALLAKAREPQPRE